ncbi:MAG: peptidoglycan-binding protein [Candidatus Microthrix sp.]|nr:peptidoglycan-binding protein [Candidatus Microthrix sp.]
MDGKFGPLTETAVKDFQLGWLTVDGIVGGKTWAASELTESSVNRDPGRECRRQSDRMKQRH